MTYVPPGSTAIEDDPAPSTGIPGQSPASPISPVLVQSPTPVLRDPGIGPFDAAYTFAFLAFLIADMQHVTQIVWPSLREGRFKEYELLLVPFTIAFSLQLLRMYYYLHEFEGEIQTQKPHFLNAVAGLRGFFERFLRLCLAAILALFTKTAGLHPDQWVADKATKLLGALGIATSPTSTPTYDLRLMSVAAADGLVNEGRNLVIVALVGTDLHIRIFDASGKTVVDKAENELVDSRETLTALKRLLTFIPDESGLSKEDKQKIIGDATSMAGYATPREFSVIAVHTCTTLALCFLLLFAWDWTVWGGCSALGDSAREPAWHKSACESFTLMAPHHLPVGHATLVYQSAGNE